MAKSVECELVLNTRMGKVSRPIKFKSTAEAVKFAKNSGYFAFRVFVYGKVKRSGVCE